MTEPKAPTLPYAKPVRSRRLAGRRWLLAGVVVFVFVAAVVGAVVWLAASGHDFLGGTDTERLTPARIQSAGLFTLPPGATNVHAHLQAFQDYCIHIRFDVPPAQLPAFVASTRCAGMFQGSELPSDIVDDPSFVRPWWAPGRPFKFTAGSWEQGMTKQEILIDESDPTRYVVYVIVTG
jgi:hypothetical protein